MPNRTELPNERFRSRLLDWSLLRLSELAKGIEYTRFDQDKQQARVGEWLADGVILLQQVIDAFFDIAKTIIDTNPRDLTTLGRINAYVAGLLRHWDPENDRPQQWEVDLYRQRGDVPESQLAELERQAARNEERAAAKSQINRWRAISRFGMLWWIERHLRQSGDADYRPAWEAFAAYFGSTVEETAQVVDAAMIETRDRNRWHTWIPVPEEALQGDAYSFPSIEREFQRTFVVLALRQINPDALAPDLGLVPSISSQADEIEQYAREAQANEVVAPLLPEDRLDHRLNLLIEAVQRSRELGQQAEEEGFLRAILNEDAVETFRDEVRGAWRTHRFLPNLLRRLDAYELIEGTEGEEVGVALGRRDWQLKRWFIGDAAANLVDQMGRQFGLALADGETSYFLEQAAAAPGSQRSEADALDQSLRAAIAAVRERGQEVVVLAPFHWRWSEVLNLEPPARYGGTANPPGWLSGDMESRFAGLADGVPIVQVRDPELKRMLVFAADTFARWRQWHLPDEHEISASVMSWDEEQAPQAAAENPGWFGAEMPEEERPRELRLRVLLDVHERLEIEIVDAEAGRWVPLRDDELQ